MLISLSLSTPRIRITLLRSSPRLPRVKARSHLIEGTRRAASGRTPLEHREGRDGKKCQANDKLTYLNERQIDLPVDVRFLRFFGSQQVVQRADGRELP